MSEIPPPTIPPSTPPPPGGGSYTPPPPPSGPGGPAGGPAGSDRTLMVALSYIGILFLIPLLAKKDDSEVQWHAKNGMGLFVAEIIIMVLLWVIQMVAPSGCGIAAVLSIVSCAIWIGFIALAIVCIVKGINGQRFRIPVITDFVEKM